MRSNGYSVVGSAVRNPNMPENGLIAYSINAQAGQCYTPIAIGRPGQNLTMTVIDAQGQQVGANVNPDHHPFVQVCGATGRLVVRLQMVAGGGEYYYVAYQGPPNQQPDLAALLGGTRGPSVQRAQLDPQTQQRIAALDQRLLTQRYQRLQAEAYGEALSERQDRLFNLNLEANQCYAFATFAGNGVGDTDVYIQDAAGNELRQDVRQERDAVVEEFCPTEAGRYTLRTLLYQGQGPVFTVGYVQSRGATPQPAANVIASEATSGGEDWSRTSDCSTPTCEPADTTRLANRRPGQLSTKAPSETSRSNSKAVSATPFSRLGITACGISTSSFWTRGVERSTETLSRMRDRWFGSARSGPERTR